MPPSVITKRSLCSIFLLSFSSLLLFGQINTTPGAAQQVNQERAYNPTFTFDIASIREDQPTMSHSVRIEDQLHTGSFVGNNITVDTLISAAYGIDFQLISDKAGWNSTTHFDVVAKADPSVNEALMKLDDENAKLEKQHMMYALLVDRFKLRAHKEAKLAGVYELRLDNDGQKSQITRSNMIGAPKNDECQTYVGRCGRQSCGPDGCHLVAKSYSMSYLCTVLQAQLGVPVLDKTGLTGNSSFGLDYHAPNLKSEVDESTTPSVFAAVRDQLGLRLIKTNSLLDYVIVDSIEKPSPN